jgi:5'-nucleotidase
LNGIAIDPAASYSVTVNSFLAAGGDNFFVLGQGTNKRDTGQTDLQAMVDYMNTHTPVSPDYTQRSVGVMFPAGAPASYFPGDQVSFDLSSLAFSTAADLKDSSVTVSLGGSQLGTFGVDNTLGTAITDEYGTASVSVTLPAGVPAGQQNLTVTGVQTGTTATVPITIAQPVSTTTTLSASASSQTYGTSSPRTLTATVVQSNGVAADGMVRFESSGTVLAIVAVSSGQASYQLPSTIPAGTLQLTATFVPSAAHGVLGSTSAVLQFTVNKAVSTTALTATGGKVKGASSKYEVAMTATVSLNTGKPAVGTVAFYLNGVVVAQAPVGAGGQASVTVPAAKGQAQVRAQFTPADTANHLGSTSPTLTVNVK